MIDTSNARAAAPATAARLGAEALVAAPGYAATGLLTTLLAVAFAAWMEAAAFGGFVFAFHTVRLASVVSGLGLGAAAPRFLPRYRASGATAAARGFERFGFRVTVVSSVAAGALLYAGAGLVATETGHSTAPLSHAWWIVPLMATALFCAGVMRAGGSVLLANVTTGAVRNAVALLIGYSLFRVTGQLSSVGAIQAVAAAVALGLALQLAALLRARTPVSGPANVTDRRDWLRTSMQMGYAGLSRVIIAAIVVIILRVFVGEVAAGAFHLATAWAVWATIPGLVLAAVAGRHVAAAPVDSWISLVRRSVRLAIVPTVVVAALTLAVAHLALAGGGESQVLARELLVPVILIAMLRSMAFVVGSGLSFAGRSAEVAWLLTAMWLAIAIGSALFATAVGLLAAAWWVVAVYVLALAALFTRLR